MGRKQPKSNSRREQPDTSAAENSRARSSSDATDPPKQDDYRFMTWLSVGGILVAAICLLLFFQSDVRDKIVASNAAAAQAEAARIAAMQPVDGKDGRDGAPGMDASGVTVPGEDNGSDDSDSLDETDETDGAQPDGSTATPPESSAGGEDIVIAPGAVIDREALTGYLSQMERDDFIELAESVDMLIADDPTRVNLPERKSLAEAYAEAESLYPGQIDASQRLKLVAEINAIDYKYYIAEDGDTLLELSKAFRVPLGQLVELNGIKDADKIPAGMVILFPSDTKQ